MKKAVTKQIACGFTLIGIAALVMTCAFNTSRAMASKQVIAYFGTETGTGSLGGEFGSPNQPFVSPGDIAVNWSGAGPAGRGEIYVLDNANNRIQRFAQNDNGTPANPYDDHYPFVSAWGRDVDGSDSANDYEICTVASSCKAGTASGGNGGLSLQRGGGIAVDQDTGDVYVTDSLDFRINVYSGDGVFLRSFGYDVVESGPGNTGGFEICNDSAGDVCKAGISGSGIGQLAGPSALAVSQPDGDPATGSVFVADPPNARVNVYDLTGSNPSSFGSAAQFDSLRLNALAVDSRGIVYVGDLNNSQEIDRYDTENANGNGVGFMTSIPAPPLLPTNNNGSVGLEVDPDDDGPGPDSDVLYVLRTINTGSVIQQFGPINQPGLAVPPAAVDDTHGETVGFGFATGLGFDAGSKRLFVSTFDGPSGFSDKTGVYVLDTAGGVPSANLSSVSGVTASQAIVNASINPNGGPPVSYHLEYSQNGSDWTRTPPVVLGVQETPQNVDITLNPPGVGLEPGTTYQVRLVVQKDFTPSVSTPALTFTTQASPPVVETVGSPIRSATTARFEGRINPRNLSASYHFEYSSEGPCDVNPCTITPAHAVGSGGFIRLVSQDVEGLEPDTTYHYRVVGESSAPGSPSYGDDRTVVTRESDLPLTHGRLPGPPDSDRSYELVSAPDTGGNPVLMSFSAAFSDDGERATYGVAGGTRQSDTGSAFNQFYAERTDDGWSTRAIFPKRDELAGTNWLPPAGRSDLSKLIGLNFSATGGGTATFSISPDQPATKLWEASAADYAEFYTASEDGSTVLMKLRGSQDPSHPTTRTNLYDVSSGTPKLVSLLPGDVVAPCGVEGMMPVNFGYRTERWVSPDGSRVFFPSQGGDVASCSGSSAPSQVYMRDLATSSSRLLSGPPLSGLSCAAQFLTSTNDAAFFWTQSRLTTDDTPSLCEKGLDGDVYRFDFGSAQLSCVTCVVPGADADIAPVANASEARRAVAISGDGSRVYFRANSQLMPGAATPGIYRVTVPGHDLAYVAPAGEGNVGVISARGNALNEDGSTFVFMSASDRLNPVNGTRNGETEQYYLYNDNDRSLVCVSCPVDGSLPAGGIYTKLVASDAVGPNVSPLSEDGTFVFRTPTTLLGSDQNGVGPGAGLDSGDDIYEWRDGRLLLVTDGMLNWAVGPSGALGPEIAGISPSGRDLFIVASAQYTTDAVDAYARLYDARIGGGFEVERPAKPCPLEVCQGVPKGSPGEMAAGSSTLMGPGNRPSAAGRAARCPRGKVRVRRGGKARCIKRAHKTKKRAHKAKKGNSRQRKVGR